jgi:capsule polysaccharide export protein KpsE/RkpR
MGFVRVWVLVVLILNSIGDASAWADKPSCADHVTWLHAQIETMRQELTKKLQPTGAKPDAKATQALEAEQERLGKADGLLREAHTAAQASDEPTCREKLQGTRTLLRP